ncbi:carboxypeptidase-like regulatory domain-containing protein [Neolewinella lacunae]|uniref:Carboxypeptidase-like regulatory domain-containing protein n=1 Tax=Neolewinella lacunae TaxID=1517758 RepID=A0A923PFU2_9BACT|nr:TonB-dependent receptor [Neolewinella lacunae]MBC6993300.1 carboxypeptidase-like regulatory domain-containing protein [Neolewinella lacunae]MDN3636859.1 carboxypeptidase-like regulatory domain-containing protein [Neolewinella lacunae]
MRLFTTAILFFALAAPVFGQSTTLKMTTIDASTRSALGFVNVQIEGSNSNGTTDENGDLTLTLPRGKHFILASFVGYETLRRETLLSSTSTRITLELTPTAQVLQTIEVRSNDASERLERPMMGVERLSIADIEILPVALGEVDVFRGLQLLSGVNSAGEASNGLSIRGGTIDQNLVLFDGAPIFTPTHLFGLFSVFTPDALGSVDLYRANIPARFGGRIASVLDVRSRNPSSNHFKMQGGIGLVSSHLSVETPLTKNKKLQLLAGGRAGLSDFLFTSIERLKNTESRFFDSTVKLRYTPNPSNIFTLVGFYSKDFYQIDLLNRFNGIVARQNQNDYFTLNGTAEWLKIFSDRTSLQTRLVRSNHRPQVLFPQEDTENVVSFASQIRYTSLQSILETQGRGGHHYFGGIQLQRYDLNPGTLDPGGAPSVAAVQLDQEQALEASIFVEDEWMLSEKTRVSLGLRYTHFLQLGPGEERSYGDSPIVEDPFLESTRSFAGGQVMHSYGGLEPRLGISHQLSPKVSLKAAYASSRQYLQNIFNATTPVPSSRWKVADNNVRPQRGQLVSSGAYFLPGLGRYEISVEAYYRAIEDLLEYKPGAEFFLNPRVETDIIQGQGQAYGVEIGVKKRTGTLTGEINYAYARSRNRVPGPTFGTSVNGGEWYNGYFDQPHTFNSNFTIDDGRTNRVSFNFVVQSNRPYTVPNGFLTIDNQPIPIFLERNNDRMPLYHRLDFSWTIHNPRLVKKRWVGDWTVTVYNLYGRKNAYNIYYQGRDPGSPTAIFGNSPLGSYRLTIFGAPIASLTYSFKFE